MRETVKRKLKGHKGVKVKYKKDMKVHSLHSCLCRILDRELLNIKLLLDKTLEGGEWF